MIEDLLGEPIGLFRAPFGRFSKAASAHVARRGLTVVDWTIDSLDWRERDGDRLRLSREGMLIAHEVMAIFV